MSKLAKRINGLRYDSGNVDDFEYWAEYSNEAVKLCSTADYPNPNRIDWIILKNKSAGYTLFGVHPGMGKAEVRECMRPYQRLTESDYYYGDGDCWCILRTDGYSTTVVEVFYRYDSAANGQIVTSVTYGWYGS